MVTLTDPFSISSGSVACFDPILLAIQDLQHGKFVVVMDDTSRENEGDLVIASQFLTEDKMAFMIRNTSGLICSPVLPSTCDRLNLPLMVSPNDHTEPHGTQYTISVDARAKSTTGISAHDRALTCALLADPTSTLNHFVRPGHLFPLRYQPGGVLCRRGHTEASIDLCRIAGLHPAATICELVLDNGKMMRRDDCALFARQHNLRIISVDDLVLYIRNKLGVVNVSDWVIN